MAISLRPLLRSDLAFAQTLVVGAGWNQTERDWLGYLAYEPDGCWLAEWEGRPAGTATTLRYGSEVGWIGMVLVHPDCRRRGVGSALLGRAIDHLRQAGVRCIKLDATPAGREVYLPLGFSDEYELNRLETVLPAVPKARPESVEPLRPADLPSVAAFDRELFGVDRTRVLAGLIERDPAFCFVVRRSAAPAGYLIARAGRNAVQVGPWAAEDPGVAEMLLEALFNALPARRIFVDLPEPNGQGRRLLGRYGFTVQRPFTRMSLGTNLHAGIPARIYSTGGAEKG